MTQHTTKVWQAAGSIPVVAGIDLRSVHHDEIVERQPQVGWVEAHTENYFAAGGAQLEALSAIRRDYGLSLHGVGLSLGSADPLNSEHLAATKSLVDRFEPALVSEHLCWTSIDGEYLNDLLPLPRTDECLQHVITQVARYQDAIDRQILIENVSSYLEFSICDMTEWEFLVAVSNGADCGILLDVNNIYVNALNHDFDAIDYVNAIPAERVGEIHLAGHKVNRHEGRDILIDTHDSKVTSNVWHLYEYCLDRMGPLPTLIEWDANIPSLDTLIAEASKAEAILGQYR